MGKKTKFITKENSQKFHLLHRSQTDAAYAGAEVPSEFVLVAANEMNTNAGRKKRVAFGDANEESGNRKFKDHITPLGFANDGYDYTQHLKVMGGGRFIGRDGKSVDYDFSYNKESNIELPEDALPSTEAELERDLEAITIDHELMDDDIRAALFEDADELGDFEELQDDFVSQVLSATQDESFDYDAHIAALIARSEEKLGINRARGWENGAKPKRIGKKYDNAEEAYGEDDDEDDDEYWEDEDGDEEDWEEEDPLEGITDEERRKIEIQFDRTLEEYGDEEIGELVDDEDGMLGEIELDGDNALFNNMLDEFLQDQKDQIYAEGTLVHKGTRSTVLVRQGQDAKAVVEKSREEIETAPVDIQKELEEQRQLQEESRAFLEDLATNGETHKELETCQQYLAETRVEEKWDCESILSTYSTLDNHPTKIKDANSRFRKYKSHHERSLEKEAALSQETASMGVRSAVSRISSNGNGATPQIILTGKLGLPQGFARGETPGVDPRSSNASTGSKKSEPNKSTSSVSQTRRRTVDTIPEEEEQEEVEEVDVANDGEDDDSSVSSSGSKVGNRPPKNNAKRKETAEEKKLRKQQVKAENKAKRVSKKELKTAYKMEGNRINMCAAKEQSIDHVGVFKYSG